MKKSILILLLLAAAGMARAQAGPLATATPTQANVPWTAGSCPAGATCYTDIWTCTGSTAACTASTLNWNDLKTTTLTAASGTYVYSAVTPGTSYCFAVVNYWTVSGATSNAPPSAVGCVTVPLAGTAAALGTLSATS